MDKLSIEIVYEIDRGTAVIWIVEYWNAKTERNDVVGVEIWLIPFFMSLEDTGEAVMYLAENRGYWPIVGAWPVGESDEQA